MTNDQFLKNGHLSLVNNHLSFKFDSLQRQQLVNEFAFLLHDVSGDRPEENLLTLRRFKRIVNPTLTTGGGRRR